MAGLDLNPDFWRGKRVLLTGHTGFKGAWTALWLHRLGAEVTGVALAPDKLSLFRLLRLHELIHSHVVDVRDAEGVASVVASCRPHLVLHMAAQALVGRGFAEPVESFATNVMGTVHVLNALRTVPDVHAVLVVTTDKVYANDESGHAYRETDVLGGKDPYAASKAACEIATTCMAASFLTPRGIAVATARGGNVIGGGDFTPGRLVPDAVLSALSGNTLVLRNPESIRPWQHVLDCVGGYLVYLTALATGHSLPPALNFGPLPGASVPAGELASAMQRAIAPEPLCATPWRRLADPDTRESRTLVLDSQLARHTLNWRDRLAGDGMVATTAAWYRAWSRQRDMRAVTLAQIEAYEALA